MKNITLLLGLSLFFSCSSKADIDAYVKQCCECIETIALDGENMVTAANKVAKCADYANNQEIYQDLITQYMDENPEAGYLEAEEKAPNVIDMKLMENCPAYKSLVEKY